MFARQDHSNSKANFLSKNVLDALMYLLRLKQFALQNQVFSDYGLWDGGVLPLHLQFLTRKLFDLP